MDLSPSLRLPYIMPSQAQKHVTHNEALRVLDAVVQIGVISRALASPPASPSEGDRYIVAAGAGGVWDGQANSIAALIDGAWMLHPPRQGWLAWVGDESTLLAWSGTAWIAAAQTPVNPTPLLGVNTTAAAPNRLAVKSDAALLSHDDQTPGTGDMRLVLNKAAAGNTASLLLQDGYSGRAELALAGDDDIRLKVSADGAIWNEALVADRASGAVRFPGGLRHAGSLAPMSSFLFTSGGDGVVSFYRMNTATVQNPRSRTISAVGGDVVTLTTADAAWFGEWTGYMAGVACARVWNTSKVPAQSAWVKASPATNQLQVTDAAHIAAWINGESLQLGDPGAGSGYGNRVIALDLSPMLTALFGAPFRQKGVAFKVTLTGGQLSDNMQTTPTGGSGSFLAPTSLQAAGVTANGFGVVPTTELSPISNSNLLLVRENSSGTMGIRILSAIAVLA